MKKNYILFCSILKLVYYLGNGNDKKIITNGNKLLSQGHYVLTQVSLIDILFIKRLRIDRRIGIIL